MIADKLSLCSSMLKLRYILEIDVSLYLMVTAACRTASRESVTSDSEPSPHFPAMMSLASPCSFY